MGNLSQSWKIRMLSTGLHVCLRLHPAHNNAKTNHPSQIKNCRQKYILSTNGFRSCSLLVLVVKSLEKCVVSVVEDNVFLASAL